MRCMHQMVSAYLDCRRTVVSKTADVDLFQYTYLIVNESFSTDRKKIYSELASSVSNAELIIWDVNQLLWDVLWHVILTRHQRGDMGNVRRALLLQTPVRVSQLETAHCAWPRPYLFPCLYLQLLPEHRRIQTEPTLVQVRLYRSLSCIIEHTHTA